MPPQSLVLCHHPVSGSDLKDHSLQGWTLLGILPAPLTVIQITASPSGGIKALRVLLSQGTGGKFFPPLITSNQRFGEMLRGFISFIGGFLASRVLPVAMDGAGAVQPEGSRGNLCLPWL